MRAGNGRSIARHAGRRPRRRGDARPAGSRRAHEHGRPTPCTSSRRSGRSTAIRALPEAYRETLVLRLIEGMTGPEIARRTGLTPDSVRVNLCRGMKLLRQALDGTAATRTR